MSWRVLQVKETGIWGVDMDWAGLFALTISPFEIVIRGSVIYMGLFLMLRVILKREAGALGVSDLLMIVLLSEAVSQSLGGEATSIGDAFGLVLTIIFWNFLLDWLAYRFPLLQKLIQPPPLKLVENGHLIRRNMRKEFVTEAELMAEIRQNGLEDLSQVHLAFMETDGRISVLGKETERQTKTKKPV